MRPIGPCGENSEAVCKTVSADVERVLVDHSVSLNRAERPVRGDAVVSLTLEELGGPTPRRAAHFQWELNVHHGGGYRIPVV
jgi:hypothetical protein